MRGTYIKTLLGITVALMCSMAWSVQAQPPGIPPGSCQQESGVVLCGGTDPDDLSAIRYSSNTNLQIGTDENGFLAVFGPIKNTATVLSSKNAYVGGSLGKGTAVVEGPGARWVIEDPDGLLSIGYHGKGELTLRNGGAVLSNRVRIGDGTGTTGLVIVNEQSRYGQSSRLTSLHLTIGRSGDGTLNVESGGRVEVGTLGFGGGYIPPDLSDIPRGLSLAENANSSGTVNLSGGTLDLNGNDIVFGDGDTEFNFTGGTLAGVDDFDSDLNQQGGTLQIGNSPGTMTIHGDYILAQDADLELEIFSNSVFDVLNVNGDATLAGTIEIIFGDNFMPDLGETFDLLDIGGNFIDNGFNIAFIGADSGLSWDFNPNGGILSFGKGNTSPEAVPAPNVLVLALLGLGLIGLGAGIRRTCRDRSHFA